MGRDTRPAGAGLSETGDLLSGVKGLMDFQKRQIYLRAKEPALILRVSPPDGKGWYSIEATRQWQ